MNTNICNTTNNIPRNTSTLLNGTLLVRSFSKPRADVNIINGDIKSNFSISNVLYDRTAGTQAINRTKMIFDCKGNVTVYTEENPDFKKAI